MPKPAALVFTLAFGLASLAVLAQEQPAQAAAPAVPKPAALGMFVYPAKGQDAAQQDKDEVECYAWARQQTNIDPMVEPAPVEAAEVPKGGAVKGAAGGAIAGTAIGAIAGDTGKGAAIGATAGAMKGRRAQKRAARGAEQQAQQQTQAQATSTKDTFKKGWGACLEGRGYSVK
jgi:hypothetical protein